MATWVRVRRLHRMPLRIGKVNISNSLLGSLVDLDDKPTQRDLRNHSTRWMFVDRHEDPRVAATSTQTASNMGPFEVNADITAAQAFSAAAGGFERVMLVNLPAGFPVTNVIVSSGNGTQTALTRGWVTVGTTDGTTITYVAVSPDATSTWGLNTAKTFQPVDANSAAYITPTEGQYVITIMSLGTAAVSLVGAILGSTTAATGALVANQLAVSPNTKFSGVSSTARTTPVAVASTLAWSTVTADGFVPFVKFS